MVALERIDVAEEDGLEAWVRQLWRTLQVLERAEQRKVSTLVMGGKLEYDVHYHHLRRTLKEGLGADPNLPDLKGNTPLSLAVERGDLEVLRVSGREDSPTLER